MDVPNQNACDTTMDDVISLTAPGTALRLALDMIIAGHLGALICVGDSDASSSTATSRRSCEPTSTSTPTRRCPRPRPACATAPRRA